MASYIARRKFLATLLGEAAAAWLARGARATAGNARGRRSACQSKGQWAIRRAVPTLHAGGRLGRGA